MCIFSCNFISHKSIQEQQQEQRAGDGIDQQELIYRCPVRHFTNGNSTVNLCALDKSKASDSVNHYALFIKLMNRIMFPLL